jgi:hypothetical protein
VNTFTAFPTLVKEGETATLSWHLENVTNCSITSNHPNGDAMTALLFHPLLPMLERQ